MMIIKFTQLIRAFHINYLFYKKIKDLQRYRSLFFTLFHSLSCLSRGTVNQFYLKKPLQKQGKPLWTSCKVTVTYSHQGTFILPWQQLVVESRTQFFRVRSCCLGRWDDNQVTQSIANNYLISREEDCQNLSGLIQSASFPNACLK